MSGAGRKHRAKHLTRQFLDAGAWLGPMEGESLAVCLESPRGQHVRVLVLSVAAAMSVTEQQQQQPVEGESSGNGMREQLAFLPGKFRKVIWLSFNDVIVVADGSVQLKPSPEQLGNFLKIPQNAPWRELIAMARCVARETRHTVERAPLYASTTTTTTSALPTEHGVGPAAGGGDAAGVAADEEDDTEDVESDADSLEVAVNRNRVNIRHRPQFFYGVDDVEEEPEGDKGVNTGREDFVMTVLSTVQTHWLDVCEYFTRVHCATSDAEEQELARELPNIEKHLLVILDALLTEKQQMKQEQRQRMLYREDVTRAVGHRTSTTSLASSALFQTPGRSPNGGSGTPGGDSVPPSVGVWSFVESTSTTLTSTPHNTVSHSALGGPSTLEPAPLHLPPCYAYLFAPPPPSPTSSAASSPVPPPDMSALFPETVSPTFFLTLCLNAKHNQLPGSRAMILRFLQRLLQEADLPSGGHRCGGRGLHRDASLSATPSAADATVSAVEMSMTGDADAHGFAPPRSVLQLSLSSSIVPLLDMIQKVGAELDPSSPRGGRNSMSGTVSTGAAAATRDDAERTAFVRFLCALTERMERVPDLANYFVISRPASLDPTLAAAASATADQEAHTTRGESDAVAIGKNEAREGESATVVARVDHLVPLDILMPYMTHDCTAPGWAHRRDTCRYALSAVLSLAKCPDPWVQGLVARERAIADRTLAAACTTLLTLCKIPDNDDSVVQLLYLRDVLRFWSSLCLSAPHVADALNVAGLVDAEFAQTTLASLFMSADSRVYAAACVVTAALLRELSADAPIVPAAIARAVLGGVVNVDTGRRCCGAKHADYYDLAMKANGAERKQSAAFSHLGSFFDFFVLSHLTTHPTLTEGDLASQVMLQAPVSEWTAVEATLMLVKVLAEHCPYLFAKYAFLVDMNDVRGQGHDHQVTGGSADASEVVDLSASRSAPDIDVNAWFPVRLRIAGADGGDDICGVSRKQLSEEVLTCMLRMEANAPVRALYERQMAVSAASIRHKPTPNNEKVNPKGCETRVHENKWYCTRVAQAPLTRVLAELFGNYTAVPFRSALLLTQACLRVCLLPDLRVLYTLLDPAAGPLATALRRVSAQVTKEIDDDETFAVASAAAAAAVTTIQKASSPEKDKMKTKEESRLTSSRSAGFSGPVAEEMKKVPPTPCTLAYLYRLYLSCWQFLPRHVLSSLADERDTRALEKITAPPTASTAIGPPGTVSDDAMKGLIRHLQFLEACASLEQFRVELDAAVGYMALSHNLMTLKV